MATKLTATTPHGTFTRKTDRSYQFVVVQPAVNISHRLLWDRNSLRCCQEQVADYTERLAAGQAVEGYTYTMDQVQVWLDQATARVAQLTERVAELEALQAGGQVTVPVAKPEVQWASRLDLAQKAQAKLAQTGPAFIFPVDGTGAPEAPATPEPVAAPAAAPEAQAKLATVKLSTVYLEWAHKTAAEDGEPGSVEIMERVWAVRGQRVTIQLTEDIRAELRSVAALWADMHADEDVPAGFIRTARRILDEVAAPAAGYVRPPNAYERDQAALAAAPAAPAALPVDEALRLGAASTDPAVTGPHQDTELVALFEAHRADPDAWQALALAWQNGRDQAEADAWAEAELAEEEDEQAEDGEDGPEPSPFELGRTAAGTCTHGCTLTDPEERAEWVRGWHAKKADVLTLAEGAGFTAADHTSGRLFARLVHGQLDVLVLDAGELVPAGPFTDLSAHEADMARRAVVDTLPRVALNRTDANVAWTALRALGFERIGSMNETDVWRLGRYTVSFTNAGQDPNRPRVEPAGDVFEFVDALQAMFGPAPEAAPEAPAPEADPVRPEGTSPAAWADHLAHRYQCRVARRPDLLVGGPELTLAERQDMLEADLVELGAVRAAHLDAGQDQAVATLDGLVAAVQKRLGLIQGARATETLARSLRPAVQL